MTRIISSIRKVLDDATLRRIHYRIFVMAALGIFMDGYDFFIIAVALPVLQRLWHPSPAMLGLIGASATMGAIVGGVVLGRWADRLGRRLMSMVTMVVFAILSLLSAVAWSPLSLIAVRFVLGAAIGADYPTGAAYVAEFSPKSSRARLLVASFSFQALGAVAGAIVGLTLLSLEDMSCWRWMLAAGAVPAIVILLLRSGLTETPEWLVQAGRQKEAAAVVSEVLGEQVELGTEEAPSPALPFSALLHGELRRKTILASVPWFAMDVAFYGMSLFTPVILSSLQPQEHRDFWTRDVIAVEGALGLDMLLVVGFVLAIALIGRLGVIRQQLIGFTGMIVGLVTVALSQLPGAPPWLVFAGFGLFNLALNMGPNSTTYLLAAEIFPTSVRASGAGLATSAGKIGATAGIFLIPIMQAAWGLTATVLAVAAVALVGLIVTWLYREEAA